MQKFLTLFQQKMVVLLLFCVYYIIKFKILLTNDNIHVVSFEQQGPEQFCVRFFFKRKVGQQLLKLEAVALLPSGFSTISVSGRPSKLSKSPLQGLEGMTTRGQKMCPEDRQ